MLILLLRMKLSMATEAELKEMFADKLEALDKNSVKKSDFDSLVNSIKHEQLDKEDESEKDTASDFIDHMTTCSDKTCSMHIMHQDIKKHGFLEGYALAMKNLGKGI